jgi:hypothetical protein
VARRFRSELAWSRVLGQTCWRSARWTS